MAEAVHIPVLPREVMTLLAPQPGETVVDLTVGLGGHAELLSEAVGEGGTVVGFDLDEGNLAAAASRLQNLPARFISVHAPFSEAPQHLARLGLRADIVLADLGFSSSQMDDPVRGFSFTTDGPLDMRMDRTQRLTAADLLADSSERELADLIYRLGEDPFARRIARKLAQIRHREPIRSTARLAEAVVEAYGPRARALRTHPATRTFMALRIAVNDELGRLQTLLDSIARGAQETADPVTAERTADVGGSGGVRGGWLRRGARIAIISFHSLEDRLVKHAFADMIKRSLATRLTRKPLTAGEEEVRSNPRARSAKLRAIILHGEAAASPSG